MDVKLTPVRCTQCKGSKKVLMEKPDGTLPKYFVDCPGCNGLGVTYEMSVDALNLLKLITPRVKGTATSRPPATEGAEDD